MLGGLFWVSGLCEGLVLACLVCVRVLVLACLVYAGGACLGCLVLGDLSSLLPK